MGVVTEMHVDAVCRWGGRWGQGRFTLSAGGNNLSRIRDSRELTEMTPAHQSPAGPLSLMMAMGMAFLAFLFVPARRRAEDAPAIGPEPRPAVDPVPFAPLPAPFVPPSPPASMPPLAGPSPAAAAPAGTGPAEAWAGRPEPTALGRKVLDALEDSGPMRKCDVAALVGIGRGSANRIVDRLTQGGWLRRSGPDTYVLA